VCDRSSTSGRCPLFQIFEPTATCPLRIRIDQKIRTDRNQGEEQHRCQQQCIQRTSAWSRRIEIAGEVSPNAASVMTTTLLPDGVNYFLFIFDYGA